MPTGSACGRRACRALPGADGARQRRVTELAGINPTMLSRVIGKLDGDGLIRRTPNPDDQRAALVEATDSGWETSERIRAARTAVVVKLGSGLPKEYAAAVVAALPALEAFAGLQ